jgi:environmental stress-induced protein Ves
MAVLIPIATLQAAPWKNGGGSTTEIAVWPPGADFEAFDWRISLATIAADGPFSIFPGIDRTLTLVDGGGVDLALDDGRSVALRPDHPTFVFAGEWKIEARLAHGETTDFNVMTRRARCVHRLERVRFSGHRQLPRNSATTLLFLAEGAQVQCHRHGQQFVLTRGDALLLDLDDAGDWTLDAAHHVTLFVVHIGIEFQH